MTDEQKAEYLAMCPRVFVRALRDPIGADTEFHLSEGQATALLRARENADGWRPIETAPKDGTVIDVWVRDFSIGEGGRIDVVDVGRRTDVRWGEEVYHYGGVNGTKREEGERWVFYDVPHSAALETDGYRATHWRPLPAPPEKEDK